MDGRSSVAIALRKMEGGSNQRPRCQCYQHAQETLSELAARPKIMLDSIDNLILGKPSLINARKKTVLSVVQQRQTIADGLLRLMKELGIHRIVPPPKFPWEIDSDDKPETDQANTEANSVDKSNDPH